MTTRPSTRGPRPKKAKPGTRNGSHPAALPPTAGRSAASLIQPRPEVAEALRDCFDLGQCGQALKATFPHWSETERLAVLRQYTINLQYRWQSSPARQERADRAADAALSAAQHAEVTRWREADIDSDDDEDDRDHPRPQSRAGGGSGGAAVAFGGRFRRARRRRRLYRAGHPRT